MAVEPASSPIKIVSCDLDNPQVIALLATHRATSLGAPPGIDALVKYLSDVARSNITVWAAWNPCDRLLGIGAMSEFSLDQGEVKYMHTAQAERGRGVGSALLEHIISVARSRRYANVWVETGTRDVFRPALALYRKFGFTECGPFGDYNADPRSAFLRLPLEGGE